MYSYFYEWLPLFTKLNVFYKCNDRRLVDRYSQRMIVDLLIFFYLELFSVPFDL